ncbi:MAG: hypothetical protein WB626_07370 [Bacteroidota bacterium]
MQNLTFDQFSALLSTVFGGLPGDPSLVIMVDLPGGGIPDTPAWADRRSLALEWYTLVRDNRGKTPFRNVRLCAYLNVGSNNNDLPEDGRLVDSLPQMADPGGGRGVRLGDILDASAVVLAPTEFSATAPLKILARSVGFRGATLPGFSRSMLPTLSLDYEKINTRVGLLKGRMDRAESADILFDVSGVIYKLTLDLRHRTGHASGGLMREPGVVGNLPSGEAYIVPYEGEKGGDPSRSSGELPVQFGSEVVLFRIESNRATGVISEGPQASLQAKLLAQEPAYGNIAELGLGVLGDWGLKAMGSTLVDEKLGPHIAFGRSDHFGGVTAPSSFRKKENVVHTDWVYVPSIQPDVAVVRIEFQYAGGGREEVYRTGRVVV